MLAGEKVNIYRNPVTKDEDQGPATLIYLQDDQVAEHDGYYIQRWLVRFDGDVRQYSRAVLSDMPVEACAS